jgi:ribose/xylose/arabinose/galactoside ABC-type transport system permease subunit
MSNTQLKVEKNIGERNPNYRFSFKKFYEIYGMLLVFIVMMIAFSIISPNFLSPTNILNVLRQISITGILAIGLTYVIITAGIDLSVGSTIALVTVLVAGTQEQGILLSILIGVGAGIAVGFVNGIGIAYGKVPPFVMTLGTMSMASGLAFMYSNGLPIRVNDPSFLQIGNGYLGQIPLPAIYFLIIILVSHFILKNTKFGRYIYSIGSNEEATRLSGVNIKNNLIMVYVVSGLLAGVGGIIYTSQLGIGTAVAGQGYELTAIAAAVVGGASLNGGSGTMWGTFLGAAIIGTLGNIMNLTGVSPFVQTFLTGVIIVLAVLIKQNKK